MYSQMSTPTTIVTVGQASVGQATQAGSSSTAAKQFFFSSRKQIQYGFKNSSLCLGCPMQHEPELALRTGTRCTVASLGRCSTVSRYVWCGMCVCVCMCVLVYISPGIYSLCLCLCEYKPSPTRFPQTFLACAT